MKDNLDILLSTKTEIETPHGLEERIMRRIQNEKAGSGARGFGGLFFNRYAYGFASVASVVVVLSVMMNIKNENSIKSQEDELITLGAEIEYYKSANNMIIQVDREDKVKKDMEDIQELDDYISMLSS